MPEYQVRKSGSLSPWPIWINAKDEATAVSVWEERTGESNPEVTEIKNEKHKDELCRALTYERDGKPKEVK